MNEQLRRALSNTFAFYFKAHSFHWNIEGPRFPSLHRLFGEIYEETFEAVDGLAEHLRALDEYAPTTLGAIQRGSVIQGSLDVPLAYEMVTLLLADNTMLLDVLHAAYMEAENNMEHGLSNYLAERIDQHKKFGWMLRATSKGVEGE